MAMQSFQGMSKVLALFSVICPIKAHRVALWLFQKHNLKKISGFLVPVTELDVQDLLQDFFSP